MVGRLDEGLRGEIKRGIKTWSEDIAWHLEVWGRATWGGRRRREEVATVSRQGRKMKLIAWAHLTERREGGGQFGRREPKGKTYFHKYAINTWASWAGKVEFGPREERGQRAGWANGRVGRKVGQAESEEKNFWIKILIFEFTNTLEICTRRFRRNFDMRIFLNSSRLLKDFRKI
jgi:hypothetical protein